MWYLQAWVAHGEAGCPWEWVACGPGLLLPINAIVATAVVTALMGFLVRVGEQRSKLYFLETAMSADPSIVS